MRKPRFLVALLSSLLLAGCIVPSNGRELKTNYPMDLMEIGYYCDQVTAIDNKFSMEIAYGHSYKIKESPTYNDNEIVGPICVYMVNNEKKWISESVEDYKDGYHNVYLLSQVSPENFWTEEYEFFRKTTGYYYFAHEEKITLDLSWMSFEESGDHVFYYSNVLFMIVPFYQNLSTKKYDPINPNSTFVRFTTEDFKTLEIS